MLWLVINANELIDLLLLLLQNNNNKKTKKKRRSNMERFKSKLTCFLECAVLLVTCCLLSPLPYSEQLVDTV